MRFKSCMLLCRTGVPPPKLDIVFSGSRQVLVTWRLPSDASASLDQSVIVLINVFRHKILVVANTLPFSRRSHFINGLSPSTVYVMAASLSSSAGQSNQTSEISFETKGIVTLYNTNWSASGSIHQVICCFMCVLRRRRVEFDGDHLQQHCSSCNVVCTNRISHF